MLQLSKRTAVSSNCKTVPTDLMKYEIMSVNQNACQVSESLGWILTYHFKKVKLTAWSFIKAVAD